MVLPKTRMLLKKRAICINEKHLKIIEIFFIFSTREKPLSIKQTKYGKTLSKSVMVMHVLKNRSLFGLTMKRKINSMQNQNMHMPSIMSNALFSFNSGKVLKIEIRIDNSAKINDISI